MKESEEQRYGRNKDTVVDKSVLNSGEFRRKFDGISDSPELNRLLYQLAKKMLLHRSGTKYEDMYWIDPVTFKIVAEETESNYEEQIVYSDKTKETIAKQKGLITIHSHPESFPPSVVDLNSNYTNQYSLGIVVTHDCTVYTYNSSALIKESYFSLKVDGFTAKGYNEFEAQMEVLKYCRDHFGLYFEEVTGDERI